MAQERYAPQGEGWVLFAGLMLGIIGVLNIFQGLSLIAKDEILVTGPDAQVVVIGDVSTWGWVILIIGIIEMFAAFGVYSGQQWARWVGIIIASLALIAQFPVFFGAGQLWSLTVVLLCSLVIYGLAAYGGRDYTNV